MSDIKFDIYESPANYGEKKKYNVYISVPITTQILSPYTL